MRPTDSAIYPLGGDIRRGEMSVAGYRANPLLSVAGGTLYYMYSQWQMRDSLSLSNMSDLMVLTISHLCLSALPRRERSAYHCSACASLRQYTESRVVDLQLGWPQPAGGPGGAGVGGKPGCGPPGLDRLQRPGWRSAAPPAVCRLLILRPARPLPARGAGRRPPPGALQIAEHPLNAARRGGQTI